MNEAMWWCATLKLWQNVQQTFKRSRRLNNATATTTRTTTIKCNQLNIIFSSAHGWIPFFFFFCPFIVQIKVQKKKFYQPTKLFASYLIPKRTSDYNAVESFYICCTWRKAHIESEKRKECLDERWQWVAFIEKKNGISIVISMYRCVYVCECVNVFGWNELL